MESSMVVAWKDPLDKDTFHVGVRTISGGVGIWLSMNTDAVHDCFGADAHERFKRLDSTPTPVQLSARF